ncbi:hypothetical protein [Candidatus Albibeggiatoa sp. nov. NOAA]|uniref:hypothetical protein n=1 Tax=Candidatus Albibeggiatoa sp. nov. NOAA TaxID=3162724 RepID=UPI0032F9EE40|nr:hypothetical protein [Thiotrichaceae bacterium]
MSLLYPNIYMLSLMFIFSLVHAIAIFRAFTVYLLYLSDKIIYLNPNLFGKTKAINIAEIQYIQIIEDNRITDFVFNMKDGEIFHYRPNMQDKKIIQKITHILAPYTKQISYKRTRCT